MTATTENVLSRASRVESRIAPVPIFDLAQGKAGSKQNRAFSPEDGVEARGMWIYREVGWIAGGRLYQTVAEIERTGGG